MASTTLEALRKLEKHERTVVDQFGDERVNLDGLGYEDMLKVVQNLSSSVLAHGKDYLGARSDVWGAGGAQIPLPILLTIQGGPVVDVAPIPEEELIRGCPGRC